MFRLTLLSALTLAAPAMAEQVFIGVGSSREMPASGAKLAEVNSLAAVGDPKAIRPAVEGLKNESTDTFARDRQLKDSVRVIGLFGYAPAANDLVPMLQNQQFGPTVRDEVLIALGRMNDKKLIPVLKRELTSYRSLTSRSYAAKALVAYGEPEGRPFLLAELQNHLDELDNPRQFLTGVRDVMKSMADQELADAVAAMADKQKTETAKTNATSLAGAMRINLKPIVEIVAIAQDNAWAKKDDRYAAITALAERGTPAEIPAMLALKPWDAVETDAPMQRHDLRQRIATAVGRIQARHWQQLSESNTPLVTNAQRRLEDLHGDPPLQIRPGGRVPRPLIR
jgi:HEAT repeat protein